jgi:Carboxypeptidase regulatory-like domain/TonB-dependent Receptor Plug Domain
MFSRRLSLALLVLFISAPAFAQRFTAAMRGTVTDPTSAVIAGAKVTVVNENTGLTRTMNSNADGNYSFSDLPVGSYRLEVEFAGFKTAVRNKVVLNVADVRAVDVVLETGAISESVSVEASSSAVKTVGAEISGLITGEQVRELPLNGRNFLQLTLLQPGVTANQDLNTVNKGLAGGSDISVSGGSTTSNLWLIDGADNVDHGSNRTIMVYPSIDAIEEFKIQRNNYGAEFGQAGGATVNLVTRSGTNTFHGSAYYFIRRDSLNSNNYFLEQAGQEKPELKWDDWGATLGGPVIKDKLHFFVSYEKNKDTRTSVRSGFVPTAAERAGDFSGSTLAGCTPQIPNDPLTGQPFPGNVIPANRLNPAGVAFVNLYQLPNNTPSSGCNNYVEAVPAPVNWSQINARMDWSLSNSTRVMVRYTQDAWKADNTILWGDSQTSTVGSDWDQPGKSLVAQLNQNIGSKMTNTLTFSYSANKITASRTGDSARVDAANSLIPTTYQSSSKQQGGNAQPWWWGSSGYGDLWNQSPWVNNQDLYVIKDDFSAVFGKHFLKAGAFYSSNAKNEEVNNTSQESVLINGASGYLTPGGYQTGLTTGNGLADVLLAGTVFNTTELVTNPNVQQRWHDIEFYVADSYKVAPRWTLDFGVRFSHMQPPFMADDRMGNFVPSSVNPSLGDSSCNGIQYPPGTNPCPALGIPGGSDGPNRQLLPTKFLWFAPRLGVAWDVYGNGTMAIRAGLGRFYQRDRVSPGLGVGTTPPFSGSTNVTRTLESAASVTGGVAPGYGAASNALEQEEANSNYWQWNIAVEKEIVPNTVIEVAYVGSKGLDLFGQTNLNEVAPENRLAYAQTGNVALRPLNGTASIGDGNLALWQHNRESIYHSLQTAFRARFGRGSVLAAAYTWSKLMANTGVANADGPGLSGLNAYTDSTQPDLDRARGANDVTHSFNANLILALPMFEESGSFVKNVFGDWEFTTIVQAATGYPLTVTQGNIPGLSGNGVASGTGSGGGLSRPNLVPGVSCTLDGSDPTLYLNPAAWTLNGYQIGTNGNAGRNICDGPGLLQVDASLYKNIKLGSRVKLQLRFEVFNLFNRTNFLGTSMTNGGAQSNYNPGNVVFNTGSGTTATEIVSATPAGNFGQLTAARDPRTAQVGIRLMF